MILVVADHDCGQRWCMCLTDSGLPSRHVLTLSDAEALLAQSRPDALLVEWPVLEGDVGCKLSDVMDSADRPRLAVLVAGLGVWADSARQAAARRSDVVVFEKPVGLSLLVRTLKNVCE